MACQASMVIVSLVMAMLVGGCATHSATNDAANAAYNGSAMTSGASDRTGANADFSARPRLGEFVAQDDLRDVHFAFDSYEIGSTDAALLQASTEWMKAHPRSMMVIEGHADERGTNEYNLTLGERRARASMNYLVSHGVAATRIAIVSYGEERGVCHEHSEPCWSQNRRAHFLVKLQ